MNQGDEMDDIVGGELMVMEPVRPVSRWTGELPARPTKAAGPGTVGSLDWVAQNLYGGPTKFVELMWALLASEGRQAEEKWKRLVNVYLGWCEEYDPERDGPEPPSLNEACAVLRINLRELLGWLGQSVTAMMAAVAKQRMGLAAVEMVNAAIEAGREPGGFKDREMILAATGAIQPQAGVGVTINNTQQVAVVNKEQMKAPLLKFAETTEAIDEAVRGVAQDV